jgi:hypothetical protein
VAEETPPPPGPVPENPIETPRSAPEPAPGPVPAEPPPPAAIAAAAPVPDEESDEPEPEDDPPPAAEATTGEAAPPVRPVGRGRPDLADRREPLYRECRGYRLRLDPPDLARLRELAGSRGRSDTEIGEAFFDGQGDRLAASIEDDVPSGNELRVVVDPYSRQAFLALDNRIRGILSF